MAERRNTHGPTCAHCAAVKRPHPDGCAHCAAVSREHGPGCGHCRRVRELGREYASWRVSAETARDEVCIGYATEEQLYGPMPTFRDYLEAVAS